MALFQTSVLKKYLHALDKQEVAKAYKKFSKYFHDTKIQENIISSKEEEYQGIFLTELFVKVLGYTMKPNDPFNLVAEYKNEKNSKKADGAILKDDVALGVIELKGSNTKDLEKVRQQAFDYKANQSGCVYVITSNFEKIRFYINNAVDFEEFDLFTLTEAQFQFMYLCLAKHNLLSNIPLRLKEESLQVEESITKKFYADYSLFKRELFRDLVKLNIKNEIFRGELNNNDSERATKNIKQTLFKKSQKLIDRFLFIFFAEDRGLLPPNSAIKILEQWKQLQDLDEKVPLYSRYKKYFSYLDQGRKGTDKHAEIFAYNGGLFEPDSILDSLVIGDELLYKHTKQLSNYDFESQVDVNILGHIFENSLNEIEGVNAEIEGRDFDKQKTKRKKDGIFYTPKYITKYIVDNTVGKLCTEKKTELALVDEDFTKSRKGRAHKKILELQEKLDLYRKWLLQLTILDPACGSGAFLNQALDFLIKEHEYVDELQTALMGGGLVFPNIENTILENNIYGVDLNEESVEIAKLSLWLRTAQPRRKLNNLSSNIKCGNSLIDDKKVAGDKAFKWEVEFPHVFTKGGFDVVIGNPPYVRADSPGNLLPFREHMVSNGKYLTLKGKWDLYIPFVELSINLLKSKGYSSLIIPDAYCHADYSTKSLEIYKKNNFLERIDYYPNIEVFANVGVKSVIVSFVKDKENSSFITRVHTEDSTYFENILDKYPKSFRLDYADSLIGKVKNAVKINDVLYLSKGIVGNSCEKKYKGEFKVGDLLSIDKNEEHSKLYYEGKNINKWNLDSERWIEYNTDRSPKKWSRKGFPEFFEANKIVVMRSPGKTPRAFLDIQQGIFNESAIGFVRWYDLRGVDNKSISKSYKDEKERLQFENLSERLTLDYLIAIMNSKLIKYELNANRRSNIHIYPDDWRKIRIVMSEKQRQAPFIILVGKIRDNTSNLNLLNEKFVKYLNVNLRLGDLPKKLQNWHELEFDEFITELNNAIKKVGGEKLSKLDEMEWMEVFEAKRGEALTLKAEINRTDKEIDNIVYQLYGLTDEEITIVENA